MTCFEKFSRWPDWWINVVPMSLDEPVVANRKDRAVFVLIACLGLGLLGGCGGGWQPDRQDTTGPGADGRGIYGPSTEDSRIDL